VKKKYFDCEKKNILIVKKKNVFYHRFVFSFFLYHDIIALS